MWARACVFAHQRAWPWRRVGVPLRAAMGWVGEPPSGDSTGQGWGALAQASALAAALEAQPCVCLWWGVPSPEPGLFHPDTKFRPQPGHTMAAFCPLLWGGHPRQAEGGAGREKDSAPAVSSSPTAACSSLAGARGPPSPGLRGPAFACLLPPARGPQSLVAPWGQQLCR